MIFSRWKDKEQRKVAPYKSDAYRNNVGERAVGAYVCTALIPL